MNNQISFRNTLESTQPSTSASVGALVLKGGLTINCNTPATSSTRGGALTIAGGVSIGMDTYISGALRVYSLEGAESLETPSLTLTDTTISSSPITGGLVLFGGIGIDNTQDSVSSVNGGTLTTAGGVAIAKTLYAKDVISGNTEIKQLTISQDATVTGGLGINNPSQAVSSSSGGAGTVAGGAAVAKSVFLGQDLVTPSINSENLVINSSSLTLDSPAVIIIDSTQATFNTNSTAQISSQSVQLESRSSSGTSISLNSEFGGIQFSAANGLVKHTSQDQTMSQEQVLISSASAVSIDSSNDDTIISAPTISIQGPVTIENATDIQDTTPSTSTSTGSLVVSPGGAGIAQAVYAENVFDNDIRVFSDVGSMLQSTNATLSMENNAIFQRMTLDGTLDASSSSGPASLVSQGGMAIAKKLFVGDSITTPILNVSNALEIPSLGLTDTTPSISESTGVLVSLGGMSSEAIQDSSSLTNGGALTITGGAAIGKTTRANATIVEALTTQDDANLSGKINVIGTPLLQTVFNGYDSIRQWRSISVSSTGEYQTAAVTNGLLYVSSDYGQTFLEITSTGTLDWTSIAMSDSGEYQTAVGNYTDIYYSQDYGANWNPVPSSPFYGWGAISVSSTGQYQTAVGDAGIFISIDFAATWTSAFAGTWIGTGVGMSSSGTLQTAAGWFDYITPGSIYNSIDSGASWQENLSAGSQFWTSVSVSSNAVYQLASSVGAGNYSLPGYLYRSTDSGVTWTQITSAGINTWTSTCMSSSGEYQFASTANDGIFKSTNYGQDWTQMEEAPIVSYRSIDVSSTQDYIAAVASSQFVLVGTSVLNETTTFTEKINIGLDNNNPNGSNTCIHANSPELALISNNSIQQSALFFGTPVSGSVVNSKKTAIISKGFLDESKNNLYFCLNSTSNNSDQATLSDAKLVLLYSSGNVGINTSTPASKLDVNGIINTSSIFGDLLHYSEENLYPITVSVIGNASPPADLSVNIQINRVGNRVIMHFPAIHFTSGINGATGYFQTSVLPISYLPNTNVSVLTRVIINTIQVGVCRYQHVDNRVRFYHNIDESAFNGGGGYYMYPKTLVYQV